MTSNIPETMQAMEIADPGPDAAMRETTRPVPAPGDGEVLIRVAAAGVNRPDLVQKAGRYPPPPGASDLPGLEVAGEIVATGPGDCGGFKPGDTVCALLAGGGYAEYATAPAAQCLPVPKNMEPADAAAIPETFFTVWVNLFMIADVKPGETVLVHGGSSGIGTTAIQLLKAFGATVYVTAGSDGKCAFCEELGADAAINYKSADYVEAVKTLTDSDGVDVVLDMVGGDYVARNVACMSEKGRHVSIAMLRGREATIEIFRIMAKRLTLTGSTLRPRSVAEKAEIAAQLREKAWPLFDAGEIAPVIDSRFPLAQAEDAHKRMEDGGHMGKIVLTVEQA